MTLTGKAAGTANYTIRAAEGDAQQTGQITVHDQAAEQAEAEAAEKAAAEKAAAEAAAAQPSNAGAGRSSAERDRLHHAQR